MKYFKFYTFLLMLIVSCTKEKTKLNYHDSILTGTTNGEGIYYSGLLNDTLKFEYPSSNTYRDIDINNDGIVDFVLTLGGSASPGHQSIGNRIITTSGSYLITNSLNSSWVDTLNFNYLLNNNLNWIQDEAIIFSKYSDSFGTHNKSGLWNNLSDKYIGTKIIVGEESLFGWIRVQTDNGWNLTLIDYACTFGYIE